MIVHCKYDDMVPIGDLKPHPKNRNHHPWDQLARLADIIEYQGWRYAVKVSKQSGFVTSGHGRIDAAKLKGWDKVPVVYQDYKDSDQEYADLTADNAIASWAELDFSGINGDLGDLGPDFDIEMLGLKDFTLDPPPLAPITEGEQAPSTVDETKLNKQVECPSCGHAWIAN